MTINERLDELFAKWEEKSRQNGETAYFCKDGVIHDEVGGKSNLWETASKKVAILLKDPNQNNVDARTWECFADGFNRGVKNEWSPFIKKIAYWVYGLCNIGKDRKIPVLDDKKVIDFCDNNPFAFIECKKQSGTTSIYRNELERYIQKYKEELTEEIKILDADILICTSVPAYCLLREDIYPNSKKIDNNLYYNETYKKVIIFTYHPSYWRYSVETHYYDVMNRYQMFLGKYPDFT